MIHLACPTCKTPLQSDLACLCCGFRGRVTDGVYHLHREDVTWENCLEQIRAVARTDAVHGQGFPETPERQEAVRGVHERIKAVCMSQLESLCPGATFLDLGGGGSGEPSRWFIAAGAVAGAVLDIDVGRLLCVRETEALVPIVGDGYYTPIVAETLDFVFDRSALHHFTDKGAVLREVFRVLKPGGIYVSAGNAPRSEECPEDRHYWDMWGLIETQPTLAEYERDFYAVFGNLTLQWVPQGEGNAVMWAHKST